MEYLGGPFAYLLATMGQKSLPASCIISAKDAAHLFGWKDIKVMQLAYQQATMDGMESVIAERRQLEVAIQ